MGMQGAEWGGGMIRSGSVIHMMQSLQSRFLFGMQGAAWGGEMIWSGSVIHMMQSLQYYNILLILL